MARCIINTLAIRDLDAIAGYRGNLDLLSSEKLLQSFNRKCIQIAAFPRSGKSYSQFGLDLRGMSWSGFIIFYRVLEDEIEIMRVVDGRRDLPSLFP